MSGLPFTQDISRAFAGGLSQAAVEKNLVRLDAALTALREAYEKKSLSFLRLPERTDDLAPIEALAAKLKDASDVVFLGTGGSSLGGQTLAQLAGHAVAGVGSLRKGPRVHFLDNLDPLSLEQFFAAVPLKTARFVSISKSGGTGETLLQTIAAITALKQSGLEKEIPKQLFGISEPVKPGGKNGLRSLLDSFGCELLEHDTGVGGRFSVLTSVGLLPALVLGLDIRAIREGAVSSLQTVVSSANAADVPAAIGAALNVAANDSGKPITVMLSYADRLERFGKWWVQLWAESLGKAGRGTTPFASVGPVDQHSQLQLWLAGPQDKFFTVITTAKPGTGPVADAALAKIAGEPGFAGKSIGDLVAAQGRATVNTFAKNGQPVRAMHVEKLDERAMGALLMHFMLETVFAASLLGVDPYDQPAVEEGKILAKRYLAGEK